MSTRTVERPNGKNGRNGMEFTGVKMERRLYRAAQRQARSKHQTYSEYVRQLIVQDVEPEKAA